MNSHMIDGLYVLCFFAAGMAVFVLIIFGLIYILASPRLREDLKEDFNRKLKW
jgi:hypothetical protein